MLSSLLLAGVLAAPSLQGVPAEKAPLALARAVPKEAFFLAQVKDIDGLRADFEGGAWYAFYQDEAMKGLRAFLEKSIEQEKAKAKEDDANDPREVLQALHGSVAVFGVVVSDPKLPAIGILIDPGEPRGAFEDLLAKILEKRKQEIRSSDEYAGVELKLFEQKPDEIPSAPAKDASGGDAKEKDGPAPAKRSGLDHVAIFERSGATCFVFADSQKDVLQTAHGIVDRLSGKEDSGGIEGSDLLAQARKSVASPGRLEGFVDLAKVIEMIRAEDPPDEKGEKVMKALGVGGLRWIYASGDIGKGERSSFDLAVKFPEQGYLHDWLGLLGAVSRDTARLAPRDSLAVTLAQFDVWGLWQSAWKLAAEIDKDGAEKGRAQMDAGLEQFGAEELEKSFLSQLDGRFMSFGVKVPEEESKAVLAGAVADPGSATTTSLGTAMVFGLADAGEVSAFLQSVLERIGVSEMVKTEEFQGNTICQLTLGPGAGFQWAFTKKAGILSQFPTALRAALRMEGAEKKDSVLEKESFKPFFEAHGDAGMLGLMSTPEMLKGFLNGIETVRGILGTMGSDPLPPFPSPESVDRHFKGTLVSTLTRAGGVLRFQMSSK